MDADGKEWHHVYPCTASLKRNVHSTGQYKELTPGNWGYTDGEMFAIPIKSYRVPVKVDTEIPDEVAQTWCNSMKEWGFYEIKPNEMWTMTAEEVNINRWFATFNLARDLWEGIARPILWWNMCKALPDVDKWLLCVMAHKASGFGHALMYPQTSERTDPRKVLSGEHFKDITGFDWSKEISLTQAFGMLPYDPSDYDRVTGMSKNPRKNSVTKANFKEMLELFLAQPV